MDGLDEARRVAAGLLDRRNSPARGPVAGRGRWVPDSAPRSAVARFAGFPLLVAVALAGPLAPSAASVAGQEAGPIAGVWELDPEESSDPAAVMAEAAERGEARRGRRVGRGRRGPPMGREGGGRGGMMRAGGPGLGLPETLEIESGDGELRLLLDERVQILYLDGEEHAREDGRGGRITSVAEVRGGIVRVREVRELRMGEVRVFRTFEVREDILVVRTEFTPPRGGDPLLLRSVYRRIP